MFLKGQNDKQLVPRVVIPDDTFIGFRLLGVNILSLQVLIPGFNMRGWLFSTIISGFAGVSCKRLKTNEFIRTMADAFRTMSQEKKRKEGRKTTSLLLIT